MNHVIHPMWLNGEPGFVRSHATAIARKGALERLKALKTEDGSREIALLNLLAGKGDSKDAKKIVVHAQPVIEVRKAEPVVVRTPSKPTFDPTKVWPFKEVPNVRHVWKRLLKEVSAKHGFSEKQVLSANRSKPLVACRQELFYRLNVEEGMSLAELGRLFKKDHTSVLWAVRCYQELLLKAQKEQSQQGEAA